MDTEEIVSFEQTSLDYAQQLADIQEDLLTIEPDQIKDYVKDIIESPMMEKENRIHYLAKCFIQAAKNRPLNIENLALLTKKFVDKLFENLYEKGNSFISALLAQLKNPFDLGDAGCFYYRHLIKNEVITIAELFNEIDSIEISQKILNELSFVPERKEFGEIKQMEEDNENFELFSVFGYISSSSCFEADKTTITEQILIKSCLMKWLADYFYEEFPGTVTDYLKGMKISFPSDLDEYKVQADLGTNDDTLCQIIRNDDIDSIKQIVTNDLNFNLNQKIKFYRFERNSEINKNTTLIEYATYYNSMKIFKYIFLNISKDELLEKNKCIEQKAILGNNIECIRLLDQSHLITKESLFSAIKSYATDIFIWIYQNKYPPDYFKKTENLSVTSVIFNLCIECENLQILLFLLLDEEFDVNFKDDQGNNLLYMCTKYDKRLIARFLMLNDNFKITLNSFLQIIKASVTFNHPEIFKFLLKNGEKSMVPYFSSILSHIYGEDNVRCFEEALKIVKKENIRVDKQLFEFLERNYSSEKIIEFLNTSPMYSIFFNQNVLKQLFGRREFKTFLHIVNKSYHDHDSETKVKYSVNIMNNIKIKDVFLDLLKDFDIPYYSVSDRFNKEAFELVIGEVAGNTCIQLYHLVTPKFTDLGANVPYIL